MNIRFGPDTLDLNEYCIDPENGWVVFKNAPASGTTVYVKAVVSHNLDFAVSNWDPNIGNYVFNNTLVVGIDPAIGKVPDRLKLHQNYPNPFNPVTKIRFDIPVITASPLYQRSKTRLGEGEKGGFITLKIYDMLGREITTLRNEELRPGTYEVDWNASNYPSGTYFYRLTTGDFTETRKMILFK